MKWPHIIMTVAVTLAASPALGDDVAAANRIMRDALLEHAPVPSQAPVLPDRATPGALTREHLAESEAERAAHRHAEKDAATAAMARHEMANRAATVPMMNSCSATNSADACAGGMPADMMKSRGMMPGGMMPGGGMMDGGTSGGGTQGGGGLSGGMLQSGSAGQVTAPTDPPPRR